MSVKLTFQSPKTITLGPAPTVTMTEIKISSIIDNPEAKMVIANIDRLGSIVLWEGLEYDAIGQWTDTDVIAKLEGFYGENGTLLNGPVGIPAQ